MARVRDAGSRDGDVVPFTADDAAHRTALTEVLAEHDEAILRAYVRDEAALSYPRLRAAARGADPGGASSIRCSSARPRSASASTSCSPASTSSSRARRGDPGRAGLGPRLQDRADDVGRARRLRAPVRRHAPAAPARPRRRRRGGEGDVDPGLRPGRRARAATCRRPARWRRSAASARSGSATRSASRRRRATERRASRARRSRPSSSPSDPRKQGSPPGGPRPARRAGSAHRRPPGRHRHEISVSLYGEVQKEVIQATLERDYGIAADFRETTTVCIERPARVGEADEVIRAKTKTNITGRSSPLSTNPFMATLGLRIEPAPPGSGIEFRADVEAALVPLYLFKTPEAFVGPDGGVRPRGAGRGPGRLAGDRLPGHDDRLRLRVAGRRRRPTSGGSPSSC